MKKAISILVALALCLMMLPMTVSAASATASLTGPATVRTGDTITVTFQLNGSGLLGVTGKLSYDANQVQLVSTKQVIASPWVVEMNGNNFVIYDNNQTNPINGNKALFSATFKVKAAQGATVKISCSGVTASDGNADANVGTVTYQKTVAAPASSNNDLKTLTVSNATISPAFAAGTTNYTANVPFATDKLNVTATAADAKAKVAVSSPTLTPGGKTAVKVTVTAENGAQKVYTITVSREKDPNYQASGNSKLSGIAVEGFLLSPVFQSDVTQYVVWLPTEVTSVKVSGTPADGKASVEVFGGDQLAAGQDNVVKVVCTAEDGSQTEYVVTVKRAAGHDGSVDEKPAEPVVPQTAPTTTAPVNTAPAAATGVSVIVVVVIAIAALGIGFVVGMLVFKKQ